MRPPPIWRFGKITEPNPGSGYAKYYDWCLREHGRGIIKECVHNHPFDYDIDPWGLGNEDIGDEI